MPVTFTARPDGTVRFVVRVQPRSSRACVDGEHGDAVRVRVHAAPVDGGANADVIVVLADALGVPKRDVRIVSGETARQKVVEVAGLATDSVRARLLPTPLPSIPHPTTPLRGDRGAVVESVQSSAARAFAVRTSAVPAQHRPAHDERNGNGHNHLA